MRKFIPFLLICSSATFAATPTNCTDFTGRYRAGVAEMKIKPTGCSQIELVGYYFDLKAETDGALHTSPNQEVEYVAQYGDAGDLKIEVNDLKDKRTFTWILRLAPEGMELVTRATVDGKDVPAERKTTEYTRLE